MELTSKQRAQLRAMANPLEPILHIGKGDIGENLIQQADEALEARELIKCRVLETSLLGPRWSRSLEQNLFCIVKAIRRKELTGSFWSRIGKNKGPGPCSLR